MELVDGPEAIDPEVGDTFDAHVQLLIRWAGSYGFSGGIIGGYSLGARLALGVLCAQPDWGHRGCLIGVHPGLSNEAARAQRRLVDEKRTRALTEGGIHAFISEWEGLSLFQTQLELPSLVLAEQRAVRLSHDPEGLARSLRACALSQMPDFSLLAGQLAMELDLVVGGRDDKFRALSEQFARQLPNAHLHVIPTSGHNPVLEQPEAVARILSRKPTS